MDRRNALVMLLAFLAALFALPRPASAGYAYPTPPAGFQGAAGASPNRWVQSANNGRFVAGSLSTSVTLNVGGRAVTMPAAVRVAANAASYVAPAVRVLGGPAVAGVATAAWLASHFLHWNSTTNRWEFESMGGEPVGCYRVNTFTCLSTPQAACQAWAADGGFGWEVVSSVCWALNPNNGNRLFSGAISSGTTTAPPTSRAATDTDWSGPSVAPLPPAVIPELEPLGIPVPIKLPVINPSADPEPVPQPLRVPEGSPVPVPNTSPQEWRQPVTDVVPKPIEQSPWRVEVQPKIVPSPDSEGLNDPEVIGDPNAGNPTPNPENATDCDKYPDSAGCLKLDAPEGGDDVGQTTIPVNIVAQSGWGADNASCPATRHLTVQGRDIPIPYDLFCQFFGGLRYVIIAFAWLGAGFILLGARSD